MRALIEEVATAHSPETLAARLAAPQAPPPDFVLLRTGQFDLPGGRYSFLAARPFLTFYSVGSRCELVTRQGARRTQFGDPWHVLNELLSRFELLDELDRPFPLGGAFGYWGYDLKNFVEPKLPRRAVNDLELPDCCIGFYDSLAVFDHFLDKVLVISTGLAADGSRSHKRARDQLHFWRTQLGRPPESPGPAFTRSPDPAPGALTSSFSQAQFIAAVKQALRYIRAGDIYQVNLSQRLSAPCALAGWDFFQQLSALSPAPFAAYLQCRAPETGFAIASASPEQFLRISGGQITTRPIKGTRPRSPDPLRDAQLAFELQTSPKEIAELVMITDLLRNDLGRVCEYGSVKTLELARLEKFAQVQHLVSTVEGRLRPQLTHLNAFASCFPGGSITGAPKFRAMEIIDELEPLCRGPYCGAIGYLGFNRESQLSVAIRTAICHSGHVHFNVGAGIVADSSPAAEYQETLDKARGFLAALRLNAPPPGAGETQSNTHFGRALKGQRGLRI